MGLGLPATPVSRFPAGCAPENSEIVELMRRACRSFSLGEWHCLQSCTTGTQDVGKVMSDSMLNRGSSITLCLSLPAMASEPNFKRLHEKIMSSTLFR
jgi:hypothetical protein